MHTIIAEKIKRLSMPLFSFLLIIFSFMPLAASQVYAAGDVISDAANGTVTSYNWSGYFASGGSYTSVNGTWTVPGIAETSSGGMSADAEWVGIGGLSGSDLIQAGTMTTVTNGNTTYSAWYEMLPSAVTHVSLPVRPGDSVTGMVSETSPNVWLISLRNNTTGDVYQTTQKYVSSHSSAEWIVESPLNMNTHAFLPIDDFGAVQFMNAGATENGTSDTLKNIGVRQVTLLNSSALALAVPTPVNSDGQSFSVMRTSAIPDSASVHGTISNVRVIHVISGAEQAVRTLQNVRTGIKKFKTRYGSVKVRVSEVRES